MDIRNSVSKKCLNCTILFAIFIILAGVSCSEAIELVVNGSASVGKFNIEPGINQGANAITRDSASPPPAVFLPKDDALHGTQPLEWYYWVGHLRSREGQLFGFHEVFFVVQTATGPMVVSNVDVTDITNRKHHYSTTVQAPPLISSVENGFLFRTDLSMAFGGDGRDYIGAHFDDNALGLALISKQKPVLHHGDGYTDYPGGGGYATADEE